MLIAGDRMKLQKSKPYILWILFAEAVGALAALLIRDGIAYYGEYVTKPPLTPPAAVFPIVWSVLYALMGIGAARISSADGHAEQKKGLLLWFAQLTFNFFWSILFFVFGSYGFAFLWLLALWTLILLMLLAFRRIDRPAALLQLPYLLWVSFAGYLNLGVALLNR